MKIKKLLLPFLILPLLIISCSQSTTPTITEAKVEEIVNDIPYKTVTNLGFMGGSLPYNQNDTSACPLRRGATIAIRLGTVTKQTIDAGTDNEQDVFQDQPKKAVYGLIKILEINQSKMVFTVQYYDTQDTSKLSTKTSYTIKSGKDPSSDPTGNNMSQGLDINNDNKPDLLYYEPIDKRAGYEGARYLTFISDQTKLNTTMFSLIVDQYQHNDYPGGIIGINPNGNMILSKYSSSGARAVHPTFRPGDYVLDAVEGKYQKITEGTYSTGRGRAIQENELVDVTDEANNVSYKFTRAEFIGNYDANLLYNTLILQLLGEKNTVPENSPIEKYVEAINARIIDKTLIRTLKEHKVFEVKDTTTVTPNDANASLNASTSLEIDKIITEVESKTNENEIVQMNRTILETLYPTITPKLIVNSTIYTEIIPLANVTLGSGDDQEPLHESPRKAMSPWEYGRRKSELTQKFNNEYKKIIKLGVPPIHSSLSGSGGSGDMNIALEDTYFAVGVNGDFSSSWGSVQASIKTAFFITADTNIKTASINYSKNLYSKEYKKNKDIHIYGPLWIGFNVSSTFTIPFKINMSKCGPMKYRTGFTGLYEGGFGAEMEYGWKKKKKWIFTYYKPYVSFDSNHWSHSETITYATSADDVGNMYLVDKGTISLGVNLATSVGMDICKVIWADLHANTGLFADLKVKPEPNTAHLDGTMYFTPRIDIGAGVFIGLKSIPIIGDIGKGWDWTLYKYNKPLASFKVF